MRLLIVSLHHAIASSRCMTEAFVRLGNDVKHIGQPTHYFGVAEHPDRRWIPDDESDQAVFPNWTPDLVLYLDCALAYYHHAAYANVPHIWYFQDGHMDNDMPGMAHYFHASTDSPTALRKPDCFTWLPCAYDPTCHISLNVPFFKRTFDIVHAGSQNGNRKEILKAFEWAGFSCNIQEILYGSNYANAYAQGRVTICEPYMNTGIPSRVFENAVMGNIVCVPRSKDLTRLDAKGLVYVEEPADILSWIAAVETALNSEYLIPDAQGWAAPHTWDARAQIIIDTVTARGLVQ